MKAVSRESQKRAEQSELLRPGAETPKDLLPLNKESRRVSQARQRGLGREGCRRLGSGAYLSSLPRLGPWAHPPAFLSRSNWLGLVLAWASKWGGEELSAEFPDARSSPRLTQWSRMAAAGGTPIGVSM